MIRVKRVPEPEAFDQQVRKKGKNWISKNPNNRIIHHTGLNFAQP